MNIGTIIDNSNFKVKLKTGKILGFVDDTFVLSIKCGDIFTFSGLNLFVNQSILMKLLLKLLKKNPSKPQSIGEVIFH